MRWTIHQIESIRVIHLCFKRLSFDTWNLLKAVLLLPVVGSVSLFLLLLLLYKWRLRQLNCCLYQSYNLIDPIWSCIFIVDINKVIGFLKNLCHCFVRNSFRHLLIGYRNGVLLTWKANWRDMAIHTFWAQLNFMIIEVTREPITSSTSFVSLGIVFQQNI